MKQTARSDHIIAATFSTDARSVREARYQEGRTSRAIYAIGDRYYATGKTPPTDDVGGSWAAHSDQDYRHMPEESYDRPTRGEGVPE